MKTHIATLALALLLSSCSYHNTYVVPRPTPTTTVHHVSKPKSHTSVDDFQEVTKPTSYSR
jgi:PBP1b-binding outer membrane lipoprotein LpoB